MKTLKHTYCYFTFKVEVKLHTACRLSLILDKLFAMPLMSDSITMMICYRDWRTRMAGYRKLLYTKQQSFWSTRISAAAGNSRQLWKSLKPLFTPPTSNEHVFPADTFAQYFKDKVDLVRSGSAGSPIPPVMVPATEHLSTFKHVTAEDVSQLLRRCPAKQSSLDPLPTWLIKEAADTMSPILAKMINASLLSSTFPGNHKHAVGDSNREEDGSRCS